MSGDTNTHHSPFMLQSGNGLKTKHFKHTKNKTSQKIRKSASLILTISLSVPLTFSLCSLSSHLPPPPHHFISPLSFYSPSVILTQNVPLSAHPFLIPIHFFVLLHLSVSVDQLSSLSQDLHVFAQLLVMTWACVKMNMFVELCV